MLVIIPSLKYLNFISMLFYYNYLKKKIQNLKKIKILKIVSSSFI